MESYGINYELNQILIGIVNDSPLCILIDNIKTSEEIARSGEDYDNFNRDTLLPMFYQELRKRMDSRDN